MTEIIHPDAARSGDGHAPLPLAQVPSLVAAAARAPSVHNTQPWWFGVHGRALELRADPERALASLDPAGRDMTISCGAALFGLRLAIRRLGYVPAVSLLPDTAQPDLLARVRLGAKKPPTPLERRMYAALPHRHTHRGPFSPEPLPPGLLIALQQDAVAEGASLVLISRRADYERLATLETAAGRLQRRDPGIRTEILRWTRPRATTARDGVPAWAYPALEPGRRGGATGGHLPWRDFDLGRGQGTDGAGGLAPGAAPAATAVLVTATDTAGDWLRAGQALQRLLTTAAASWVFASLSSQAIECDSARAMLRHGLGLAGAPQLVLQFGRVHSTEVTARRPVTELLSLP